VSALSLRAHLDNAVEIAKAIEAANAAASRALSMVRSQLADALDVIHDLKSQIVTKDNMIAELQELRAREGR